VKLSKTYQKSGAMVYSTATDISGCLVKVSSCPDTYEFEPSAVVRSTPFYIPETGHDLVVQITDGSRSVEYKLDEFLSKGYKVINKKVKFGMISIDIDEMTVMIGYKIIIIGDSPVVDTVMG
jgi:hypothetical protein